MAPRWSPTLDDDRAFAGETVDGPLDAYVEADIIQQHPLESSSGQTYAALDREHPLRATAMDSSFLPASLSTSVLAFGVAAMAMAMGVLFVLIGLGMRDVEKSVHGSV